MAHLLSIFKSFASGGRRTTQEWVRMRFFQRNGTLALTAFENIDEDFVETESGSSRQGIYSFSPLYSLIRFSRSTYNSWHKRFPGWRSSVAGFSILAIVVLLINISVLIWAATHLDDAPYATVFIRSCKSTANFSFWANIGINVLSTGLLAGSNYCMQCLSSPTRAEVDSAHARYSYLHIGILSLRNVMAFRKRRIILLLALALSSVPLHFVYQYSAMTRGAAQMYDVALVTPEFFDNGPWFPSGKIPDAVGRDPMDRLHHLQDKATKGQRYQDRLRILQDLAVEGQAWNETLWTNLSVTDCEGYKDYESDRGSLLVVTNDFTDVNNTGTVLKYFFQDGNPSKYWTKHYFHQKSFSISYCLSRKVPGRCRFQIHLWFLLITVLLNAMKLSCFLWTFHENYGTPLMTVGDAVASFLRFPCARSKGMCLLSENEIINVMKEKTDDDGDNAKRFKPKRLRYYHSVSFIRWTIYSTSCVLVIMASIYYYNEILKKYRGDQVEHTFRAIWNLGLGNLHSSSSGPIFPPSSWCSGIQSDADLERCWQRGMYILNVLVGSSPQLIISVLYLALNYQFTVMIQLRHWTRLATRRRPLRVSDPEPGSSQVSTYWLSLPYRYSIPILISSVALGWLASQTLYFYRLVWYDNDGETFKFSLNHFPNPPDDGPWVAWVETGLGYSALGVILATSFGVIIFSVSIAMSFQKCAPGMPLGPTNSLVIAAACHPPANDLCAARGEVKWGAIRTGYDNREGQVTHHCTITSRRVEDPVEGRWYA